MLVPKPKIYFLPYLNLLVEIKLYTSTFSVLKLWSYIEMVLLQEELKYNRGSVKDTEKLRNYLEKLCELLMTYMLGQKHRTIWNYKLKLIFLLVNRAKGLRNL